MAMIKFRDCLASELASQDVINGTFIICRDTGDMYCDTLEGERVTIAKTIHLVQGPVNSELYPEDGHLYYSITDRQVCVYHDGEFQPINVATCFKKIENCYVAKSGSATFAINSQVSSPISCIQILLSLIWILRWFRMDLSISMELPMKMVSGLSM